MNKKKFSILIFTIFIAGIYYMSNQTPPKSTQTPQLNAPVKTLDFDYYPAKKPTNTLMVILHGGSWIAGDKSQLADVGKYFADQGLSVINMNYRLTPTWQFDAPIQDIASVINQVDQNKTAYGLTDDYQLVMLGFSAGGHLATQFSLTESSYQIREVDTCISLAGIYDLDRIMNNLDGPILREAVELFIGDTPPKDASPLYQIKKDEPTKFLIVRGELDLVVSLEQMKIFVAALKTNQITVSDMIIPNREHITIFSTIPEGDALAQRIMTLIHQ